MRSPITATLFCLLLLTPLLTSASLAETITWDNIAGGDWNLATNWNPQDIPDEAGEDALIPDDGQTYIVTLNMSPSLDAVALANPNAQLSLDGQTLTLFEAAGLSNSALMLANVGTSTLQGAISNQSSGRIHIRGACNLRIGCATLTNDGEIVLNSNASSSNCSWSCLESMLLQGSGTLQMLTGGSPSDTDLHTEVGVILTQATGHRIHGAGNITAALDNQGAVIADDPGVALVLLTNDKTNSGEMRADLGAVLRIQGCTLTQAASGQVRAGGGTVELHAGAHVVGGDLDANVGGVVRCTADGVALTDVTNLGALEIASGQSLILYGTSFTNDGVLEINPLAGSLNADLIIGDMVTLQGTGECVMHQGGDDNDAAIRTQAGMTLTHAAGHTIRGSGDIAAALINEGLIHADDPAQRLILRENDKTNAGVLQASGGGRLAITAMNLTQTVGQGQIVADGGTVQLFTNAAIQNGSISGINGGVVETTSGTVTLRDVATSGVIEFHASTTVNLEGAFLANDGIIGMNPEMSSLNSIVNVQDIIELTGTGEIKLSTAGTIGDAVIQGAGTLHQNADHMIHGNGQIAVQLINAGLIVADDPTQQLRLDGNPKTNQNIMRAENDGHLNIYGTTVDQTGGGRLIADDGFVHLTTGAHVIGGTLETLNGGVVRNSEGIVYLSSVTNQGQYEILGGRTTDIDSGTLTNEGVVLVNSNMNSLNAALRFSTAAVLNGSGEVQMLTAGNPGDGEITTSGNAALTQNHNHAIRGEGSLRARMTNEGEIIADVPGRYLDLNTNPKTNLGFLRATNKGRLRVNGDVTKNQNIMTVADSGEVYVTSGTLLNEGDIQLGGGGRFVINGGVFDNPGIITAEDGAVIECNSGTLTSSGLLRVTDSGTATIDYGAFKNTGTVLAQVDGTFWSDRNASHYASGRFYEGTWSVQEGGSMQLIGVNPTILDAGVILDGPTATIHSDNAGTVDALDGMTTIGTGGVFELRGGRLYTTVGDLANAGEIIIGETCTLTIPGRLTQSGHEPTSAQHEGQGWTVVNGSLEVATGDTIDIQGGTLMGTGTVLNDVRSAGRISGGAWIGELTIEGNYDQLSEGTFFVDISGSQAGEYDHVQINGDVALAGRIWIYLTPGASVSAGDTLTVMSFISSTGTFDEFWGCSGVGQQYDVLYNPTNVQIVFYEDFSSVEEEPQGEEPVIGEDPLEPKGDEEPFAPAHPMDLRFTARGTQYGGVDFLFDLPQNAHIELEVFDFQGRRAMRHVTIARAGSHRYSWDGVSETGSRKAAGIYFGRAVITTAEETTEITQRVLLVR